MVVLHCNGRTYGNAYLITFKVGPLGTHTLAHSILPLLEAPVEGFFLTYHHIQFDVLHGCEAGPLEVEAHFQTKVTRSGIRVTLGCSLLQNK